jgi:peptidoglycan/LPS O-acetylase OafA/YrhL
MHDIPDPPAPAARWAYLDGLRGWAALLVVVHHFISLFDLGLMTGRPAVSRWGFEKYVAGTPLNIPIHGTFMVQIFFVLSGFVLVRAFLGNRTFLGALIRRYLRLALPTLAACLGTWVLIRVGLDFTHPLMQEIAVPWHGGPDYQLPHFSLGQAIGQALYTVFTGPFDMALLLDGVLWTMPIEFSGSVLILVLVFFVRRAPGHARWDLPGLLVLTCLTWGYYQFFMVCGVWLYFLHERGGFRLDFGKPLLAAAMAFLVIACASYPAVDRPGLFYRLFAFDVSSWVDFHFQHLFWFVGMDRAAFYQGCGAVCLVWSVLNSPRLQVFLGRATFLGKISFPLYLVHIPLLFSVGAVYFPFKAWFGGANAAILPTFVVFLASSLASAWIGYLLVEKPSVQLSRRIGARIDAFLERTRRLV